MIIVTGAEGMLGKRVVLEAQDVTDSVLALGHGEMNIADAWQVYNWAQAWGPDDTLINCAGIPGDIADPWTMISANALAPHLLSRAAQQFGFNLIHVSTDCVFSGWDSQLSPRCRAENETPNPDSFYGRTKLAGEPWRTKEHNATRITVVRTSFVGPEHGLMKWISDQPPGASVEGWMHAWWSGSTATAVAHALTHNTFQSGVLHLCTEPAITKLDAVALIVKHLGRDDLTVVPSGGKRIDRSLTTMNRTLALPSLEEALTTEKANG